MRKLTLKIDELAVDSFDTEGAGGGRGTVRGRDTVYTEWCTGYPDCGVSYKPRCATPADTCYGSCGCTEGCDNTVITPVPEC
ncbi:MAG TPA: hypothetical protein VFJ16_31355 [Longimicrobium sp.]|nr:hypothetical protein [Longimicrobium sp.]